MRNELIAATLALLVVACGDKDDTGDGSGDGVPAVLSDCSAMAGDDLIVEAASITEDVLTAEVAYGGGCEAHQFSLCWPEQVFAESEPVQVWLEVWHEDNGDGCEAWISESLDFELDVLADAYRSSYGGGGDITVHIGDQTVDYTVSDR